MPPPSTLGRWSVPTLLLGVVLLVLFTHFTHPHRRSESPAAATFLPVPTEGPTPAAIAELQARNKGLHWIAINARTALIVTPGGSCGTLTEIGPAQISFHTGRDDDRVPNLFSSWADAYTASEQFCQDQVIHQKTR